MVIHWWSRAGRRATWRVGSGDGRRSRMARCNYFIIVRVSEDLLKIEMCIAKDKLIKIKLLTELYHIEDQW